MENLIESEIDYDSVGTDESFVSSGPVAQEKAVDDVLGLQPISIRLQKDLLENLKSLALLNGLGYQPLIRQILTRWVDCELKSMLNDKVARERSKSSQNVEAELKTTVSAFEESSNREDRLAA
jgi:uncharacterized protein (DUF4415 family)